MAKSNTESKILQQGKEKIKKKNDTSNNSVNVTKQNKNVIKQDISKMEIQKPEKIKIHKNKALKDEDIEINLLEDSIPKRKKRNAEIDRDNMDQTTLKKIKSENIVDESENIVDKSDQVMLITHSKIDKKKKLGKKNMEPKIINNNTEELKGKIKIISSEENLSKSTRRSPAKLKKKFNAKHHLPVTTSSTTSFVSQTEEQLDKGITKVACDFDVVINDKEKDVKEMHSEELLTESHVIGNNQKLNEKNNNKIPSTRSIKEVANYTKILNNEKETEIKKTNCINESKKGINVEKQKKTRYVLFVGNIPYSASVEDIKNHFLMKTSQVISVRIPTVKQTQKPRGIAYVEFSNSTDYEKGLSLHHSNLRGRRINVEYTQSGSKNAGKKSEIISKNLKLHALRKQGKLAGSVKNVQKRKFRRNLKKNSTQ